MESIDGPRDRFISRCRTRTVSSALLALCLVGMIANPLPAQRSPDTLSELQKLNLPVAPGLVPAMYSPGLEQRALRYQKTITAASGWYNEQLKTKIPIVAAVLDKSTWGKIPAPPYPMPFSNAQQKLVVLPDSLETFPGAKTLSQDTVAAVEIISAHEAGHVFALTLGIWSANPFVNEYGSILGAPRRRIGRCEERA